jgi:hypothetical protein
VQPEQRIVTRLPLTELWDSSGAVRAERLRNVDQTAVQEQLRSGPVQFVIADCGSKLDWIPLAKRFDFWKMALPHIADPSKPIYLGEFPNQIAYIASQWSGNERGCLILLEMHH